MNKMNGKIEEEAKEEADEDSLENQQVAGKSALDSDSVKVDDMDYEPVTDF